MTTKPLLFKQIDSAEALRTRIIGNTLSAGNKMAIVRKFASEERLDPAQIRTYVTYNSQYGNATKILYI